MLTLVIPSIEQYDEEKNEFFKTKAQTLQLEHSLVSLSKWESKWCRPFLGKDEKTIDETVDYIRCMTISQNVTPDTYNYLTNSHLQQVRTYIEAPMTATTFSKQDGSGPINREIVTAEIVYYWMVAFNIPFECQKWHLNRLFTLINVCNLKANPPKKMSGKETMSRNRAINEARKQQMKSKG